MRKIYHALCKAEVFICGVGFMFLILFVFMSAILRFLRISLSWNIDLAMLLLAWTAFLGADIAWRSGQLIGIDLVTRYLPRALQKIVLILVYLVILSALIVIFIFGCRLVWTERLRTYQSMPIPYSLVTVSLVVASLSMAFSTIIKIKNCIIHFRDDPIKISAGQTGPDRQ
ncbi:TRAP transporter small permease subunit [Treponema sp. OttesenSCG-928-L16]|nr:TRAP transporter small permease subunit [Treponema sp. OttesenSCG-928-L16]